MKNVISTSDVNVFIKKSFPSLYLSVDDLNGMGFQAEFKTTHGTYWDPAIVEQVEQKLKEITSAPLQPPKGNNKSYEQGYQAGYKARAKKEWKGITLAEGDIIVQEALKQEWVLDYGYIIEACEKLLRAKNHG